MRRFAPGGRSEFEIELEAGANVEQLLAQMGLPAEARPFVAVNGLGTKRRKRLHDGDTIVLFTPMEGG